MSTKTGRHAPAAWTQYVMTAALAFAVVCPALAEGTQDAGRTGKQIVEATCSKCHSTGLHGAPRIGDKHAWSARAQRGLTGLTQSALKGIREMPAHGGNPQLTDLDLERAIIYMVNQSGGHWVEPINAAKLPGQRSGEEIVKERCSKCHEEGKGGAPKIGDRAAWIPRLKHGIDATVRSAINGHGGMPPRGGMANLTDAEIRSAILYMFNPKGNADKK